jgi:hypothetical protein
MLPLALLRARCTLKPSGYSPFEILYGRPPPIINKLRGDLEQIGNLDLSRHLQALGKTLCHISQEVLERVSISMGNWAHPHQPGDMVWIKYWKKEPPQPSWTGPHLVILATPMTVKVTGTTPWIHHSQIKKAAAPTDPNDWQAVRDSTNLLRLRFQRIVTVACHQPRDLQSCSSYIQKAGLVNTRQKPEDLSTRTQMYPLFCHPYLILLISIVAILFALRLPVTAPQDWNIGQRLLLAFCYLLIIGSLTAVRCYL